MLVAELGAQVGVDGACALAVPQQFGVDLAALCLHGEANVFDARAHSRAANLAGACAAGPVGGGPGALNDGGAGAIVHRQPQIACSALDRQVGLEVFAQRVQVPAAVKAQVARQASGLQRRVIVAQTEGIDPCQRNAQRLTGTAHAPRTAAGAGDRALVPLQLHGRQWLGTGAAHAQLGRRDLQLARAELVDGVEYRIAAGALRNLHGCTGLQLHGPRAGFFVARFQLGLQLFKAGLPIQRCRAFAARQSGLQGGVDLHAFASLLCLRAQVDFGAFGAAVQGQSQGRDDDGLIGRRARRQIANLVAAQLGLNLQTAGGDGCAMGRTQAFQQVLPAALHRQL